MTSPERAALDKSEGHAHRDTSRVARERTEDSEWALVRSTKDAEVPLVPGLGIWVLGLPFALAGGAPLATPEAAMQLNIPIVPAILFCLAISAVIAANFIFYTILGEVNGKRGPQEQISMLFVNARLFEVVALHRMFFPSSRKPAIMYATGIAGIGLGFAIFVFWHTALP
jgi:hypothetical protein